MKTIQKIIMFYLLLAPMIGMAETKEIPFTLDDRDRIIRTEQKIESVDAKIESKVDGLRSEMNARFESIDKRFEAMDKRFDQLFNYLWAFIGIFTAMMVSVFGFAFWDRKLSLSPMKKENLKTLNALRDFAKYQPRLQEILKNAGLL
ncbi:MAG: hypothetical protein NT004_06720 [Bacteroidetes bacterium]|nr:hypothetical protein [Bacteroidota bacterium]